MNSSRKKAFFLVLLAVIFCTVLPVHAADYASLKTTYIANHPGQSIIPFPWEPTSSIKVLPFNYNIPAGPDNNLSIIACRNEFEPASFIISSQKALSGITVTVPALYSAQGNSIPSTATDVRLVKVWYQATDRNDVWLDHFDKTLYPELLLKDDSLVRVDYTTQMNYLRATVNGVQQYIDITSPGAVFPADAQVRDAQTLQPFSMAANENKQIWLTVHVPENTPAGDYRGTITISAPAESPVVLTFTVTVLPFDLEPAPLEYAMYYRGKLPSTYGDEILKTGVTSEYKTTGQYAAEMKDMQEHGVLYPTVYNEFPYWNSTSNSYLTALNSALSLRKQAGLPNDHIYYYGLQTGNPTDSASLAALGTNVKRAKTIFSSSGYQDMYIYGMDESGASILLSERPAWQTVHQNGGKVFVAGYSDMVDVVGDLLDVPVLAGSLDTNQAVKWHNNGKKIFNYANPQVGAENPELYRRNYGYALWNAGYDGSMDYAYQHGYGHIWNDFDSLSTHFRDHVFAYPTTDGVIDTIQWEGFREGADDTRYLATLIQREGNDASARSIVSGSLSVDNMPAIRKNVINRILQSTSAAPLAAFTATPVSGTAPLTVTFTDASTNSPTSWLWTFGDGSAMNATARNPVHTYSAPGNYTVSLNATNAVGSNVLTRSRYISVKAAAVPVADFTGTPAAGTAPLTVTFTDASTNSPTSWLWTFGDGSAVNATARNPVHTYSAPGNYTVSLNATNTVGSNVLTRTRYVTVTAAAAAPSANFTGTPVSGTAPLTVTFTDASTNSPASWLWTFGDGSAVNATVRNPVHTYSAPGNYSVSLNATNTAGSDVLTRTRYVTVTAAGAAPLAGFTATPVSGTAPLTVTFADDSTNSPTSWNWSFQNAGAGSPVVYFGGRNLLAPNQADGAEDGTTGGFERNMGRETLSSSTESAWHGSRSLKIVTPGVSSYEGVYVSSRVSVSPSTRYTGSVYVRGASGGEVVNLYAEERKSDNSHISYTFSGDITLTTSWQRITITSPGNAECGKVVIGVITPETQAATIYVDGSQIEEGSSATAWGGESSQNPVYTFTAPGSYKVALKVANAAGNNVMTRIGYINVTGAPVAPAANFTATPVSGSGPLRVTFADTSANSPTSWSWSFGDGSSVNATARNPVHTYTAPGNYTVSLIATNAAGNSTIMKKDYISVTSTINHPPVLSPLADRTADAGKLLTFAVSATDPDNDPLTYAATGLPADALFNPATRTFSWTPGTTQAGSYNVTFTASDGRLQDSESVGITVKDGSHAPVLGPLANASVNQRESITLQITGSDPDGDALTFSASDLPAGAGFDPATRRFTWTPAYNQAGNYNVRFSATDGTLTSSKVITITAVYMNYAPEFTGGVAVTPLTIDEGSAIMVNVSASDWNHDLLTYSAVNLPSGAMFDTASRTLSWTPDYSQAGEYSITLTASDGKLQDSVIVNINVTNVVKSKNVPDPAQPPKKKIHIMLS